MENYSEPNHEQSKAEPDKSRWFLANLDNVLILNQWKENGCLPELNMLFQQISFLP